MPSFWLIKHRWKAICKKVIDMRLRKIYMEMSERCGKMEFCLVRGDGVQTILDRGGRTGEGS